MVEEREEKKTRRMGEKRRGVEGGVAGGEWHWSRRRGRGAEW